MVSVRPWGNPFGSAEVEAHALDGDLGQDDRRRDAVVDPVVLGVVRHVGRERDVDAVEAEARLVHDARAEDVGVVQGADLAVRAAGCRRSRGSCCPGGWARRAGPSGTRSRRAACRSGRELVAEVARPLVDVHGRRRPCRRSGRHRVALVVFAAGIRASRLRTTGSVTAARWASLSTPLLKSSRWRWRSPFVRHEEERLVLARWARPGWPRTGSA